MNEIDRFTGNKDNIISLVYHHMGPTGAQSLYIRTAFCYYDEHGAWNVKQFDFLKTYYSQLYR